MDENRPILLEPTVRKSRPALLTGVVPIGWGEPVVKQADLRPSSPKLLREPRRVRDETGRTGGRGRAQAQGRRTVEPVVSLASSARWASAASESG